MALKAGYKGVKKSVLDKLLQMSGALIIKSLGTALSLSDAGELRVRNASDSHSGVVQPDGVTTFIEGGLLKAQAGGNYVIDTLWYNAGEPAPVSTDNLFLEDVNDYDLICLKVTTPADLPTGIYESNTVPKAIFDTTYVYCSFKERITKIDIDFVNNTFRYTATYSNESSGHEPFIYRIYGIKF